MSTPLQESSGQKALVYGDEDKLTINVNMAVLPKKISFRDKDKTDSESVSQRHRSNNESENGDLSEDGSVYGTTNQRIGEKRKRFIRKEHKPKIGYTDGHSTVQFYQSGEPSKASNDLPPTKMFRISDIHVNTTRTPQPMDTSHRFPPVSIVPGKTMPENPNRVQHKTFMSVPNLTPGNAPPPAPTQEHLQERFNAALERFQRLQQRTQSISSLPTPTQPPIPATLHTAQPVPRPSNPLLPAGNTALPPPPLTNNSERQPPIPCWQWRVSEVIQWLMSFATGKNYVTEFARTGVNGYGLMQMDDAKLQSLGIFVESHRQEILARIAMMKTPPKLPIINSYRCFYCQFSSSNPYKCIQHLGSIHKIALPLVPPSSGPTPITISSSNSHSGSHNNSTNNQEKAFTFNAHASNGPKTSSNHYYSSKSNKWECKACPKSFVKEDSLYNHMLSKHQVDVRKILQENSGEEGKNKGNPKKPFHCDYCSKSYATQTYLKKHMRSKHPEAYENSRNQSTSRSIDSSISDSYSNANSNSAQKCNDCNETFASPLEFIAHVALHHVSNT